MEILSALLVLCEENPPDIGGFLLRMVSNEDFEVVFDN